mgnify:CR=1 FL=1
MTENYRKYIKQWLQKADNDLASARRLFEIEPPIIDTACFHCQQAVEKYLKAYLVFKQVDFEKTHDVKYLRDLCADYDRDFQDLEVEVLNDFGVNIRYPRFFNVQPDDVAGYIQLAQTISDLMALKINLTSNE